MTAQTPEDCERQWLCALDAHDKVSVQQFTSRAAAFSNRVASPSELASMVNYLQEVENYVTTFKPMAEYLRAAGRPRLGERVAQSLSDLEGAKTIYAGMYQSSVESAAQVAKDQHDLGQQWLQLQNDVLAHRQQAFDAAMNKWNGT